MSQATDMVAGSQRPRHQRSHSSKSAILKAIISPNKNRQDTSAIRTEAPVSRSHIIPLLPEDHPHARKSRVLGELHSNVQSPPCSPSKRKDRVKETKPSGSEAKPKKTKSAVNLAAAFAKKNPSSKDLTQTTENGDKENTTPPASSGSTEHTPIWAQFASSRQSTEEKTLSGSEKGHVEEEIARYTPVEYSPSKQRNFAHSTEDPVLRPTLARRPHSTVFDAPEGFVGLIARRVSGGKVDVAGRMSMDSARRSSKDTSNRQSYEPAEKPSFARKISGSSAEGPVPKAALNIMKRGGRVMAAVAALQGKSNKTEVVKPEPQLDPKKVDEEFEAMLDARNVPAPMREKMRNLTLGVKADFVRRERGATRTSVGSSPTGHSLETEEEQHVREELDKATKRSRPRSRTFTFSKSEKRADGSPSKRQKSQSKPRPTSIHIPKDAPVVDPSTPSTPRSAFGRRTQKSEMPSDYINYLKANQDPKKIEVGRLHKLRILLRNETVAWVDNFVSLDGMSEIIDLLHRIMNVEWREEHEDQLLHETLLCLKGLCTAEKALSKMDKFADELFPALLAMLFDEEKKGPAEYTTRTVIINVLFAYLSSATHLSSADLERRTRQVLGYLGEPAKPEDARPIDFVLGMRASRPYKLWCREVTNVTKEVFWIFLHQLNIVPLPKRPGSSSSGVEESSDSTTFTSRHFPGTRPPVPAAPYIGGVEWDATTYLTAHLDLLNGVIASLPSREARNSLRQELCASGFEKTMGSTLRTCKEKFYSGVHDGLRGWAAAAEEDGWSTAFVREGPTMEEQVKGGKTSPKKKKEAPPVLDEIKVDAPQLDFKIAERTTNDDDIDGWLG